MRTLKVDAAVALQHDLGSTAAQLQVIPHLGDADLANVFCLTFAHLQCVILADLGAVFAADGERLLAAYLG